MNILVVGGTGYIGSRIIKTLQAHGHTALGTARSPEAHAKLEALGATVVPGNVRDPHGLAESAAAADGVIYAVQLNDDDAFSIERTALTSLVTTLAGSGKPLVYASGVWYYGNTGDTPADEDTPPNPPALVAQRPALEKIVLDGAAQGVRGSVIRPAIVYGYQSGIVMMLVRSAKEYGIARYIADGENFWPFVHVDDVAELFVLAAERASAGSVFNAADASRLRQREVAEAASKAAGANGHTAAWPLEEARLAMGPFADALALSQVIAIDRARTQLGWAPRATTVIDDLAG